MALKGIRCQFFHSIKILNVLNMRQTKVIKLTSDRSYYYKFKILDLLSYLL